MPPNSDDCIDYLPNKFHITKSTAALHRIVSQRLFIGTDHQLFLAKLRHCSRLFGG